MAGSNNTTWTILVSLLARIQYSFQLNRTRQIDHTIRALPPPLLHRPSQLLGENHQAANDVARKRFWDDMHALLELRTQLMRSTVSVDKAYLNYQDKVEWQRQTMTVFGKVDNLIEELEASKRWRCDVLFKLIIAKQGKVDALLAEFKSMRPDVGKLCNSSEKADGDEKGERYG
ncbi:MAG: hypothetical protein Q9173_004000 [Seirophora scorigena]